MSFQKINYVFLANIFSFLHLLKAILYCNGPLADLVYKLRCPYICLFVCLSLCLSCISRKVGRRLQYKGGGNYWCSQPTGLLLQTWTRCHLELWRQIEEVTALTNPRVGLVCTVDTSGILYSPVLSVQSKGSSVQCTV